MESSVPLSLFTVLDHPSVCLFLIMHVFLLCTQHKPSHMLQVRALYGFYAEEADELDMDVGDIINVLDNSDEMWWRGELRGKKGLFPSNYTEPL